MNTFKRTVFISGFALAAICSATAQSTVASSGADGSGTGGSVSFTIGQVVYTSVSGSNGSIIQGVQQPYEITVVTGSENKNITLSLSVYPNPAADYLKLRTENTETAELTYRLYNVNGIMIDNNIIESVETDINMQGKSAGVYFLKITMGDKELKTFKIIKK